MGFVAHHLAERSFDEWGAGELATELEDRYGQGLSNARGAYDELGSSQQRRAPGWWAHQPVEVDLHRDSATERIRDAASDFGMQDLVDDEVTGGSDEIDRRVGAKQCCGDLGERGGARIFAERSLRPHVTRHDRVARAQRSRVMPRKLVDPRATLLEAMRPWAGAERRELEWTEHVTSLLAVFAKLGAKLAWLVAERGPLVRDVTNERVASDVADRTKMSGLRDRIGLRRLDQLGAQAKQLHVRLLVRRRFAIVGRARRRNRGREQQCRHESSFGSHRVRFSATESALSSGSNF